MSGGGRKMSGSPAVNTMWSMGWLCAFLAWVSRFSRSDSTLSVARSQDSPMTGAVGFWALISATALSALWAPEGRFDLSVGV